MRDAAELGPRAEGADGRLFASGKYSALAQAGDVRELGFVGGICRRVHAAACTSTALARGAGIAAACFGMMPKKAAPSSGLFRSR